MSVFEDLVDELKNENLLELTVIDSNDLQTSEEVAAGYTSSESREDSANTHDSAADSVDADLPRISEPANEREFFRKRAMEEVVSLQMVEHVLSAIERMHLKTVPAAFDDLHAKQALHKFLQVSENLKSPEHAEAEFALRQETEAWNFALYERDQKISVANVRRFCEDSRPVLSSQAMIALARFYRNSPYTEDVRGKFDYVLTRLFSREAGGEMRELLFAPDDLIGHLRTLYANWSSIVLFAGEDDQMEISLTVARFDEFIDEAKQVRSFDELLRAEFFNRVRAYKEESAELFFVPEVVAAALRCNIAIGNRYVELVGLERRRTSAEWIEEKYGPEYDEVVSNVAGKTLALETIVRLEPEDEVFEQAPVAAVPPTGHRIEPVKPRPVRTADTSLDLLGVNRWMVVFCMVFVALGAGVYIWAEKFAGGDESSINAAAEIKIDQPEIGKFVKSPRGTREALYAVVRPEYEELDDEQKKELLQKIRTFAATQNLNKVNLLDENGRSVAYASKDRLEVVE